MNRHFLILFSFLLLSVPTFAESGLPVVEIKADRTMIYPQRMELTGEESLMDILQMVPELKNDQGTLILRSDIFYQSAKLESPDSKITSYEMGADIVSWGHRVSFLPNPLGKREVIAEPGKFPNSASHCVGNIPMKR